MRTKFYFPIVVVILSTNAFSQTKVTKPLTAKSVAPAPTATKIENPGVAKPQNKPAPTPTDLQNAVVNIVVGNDGKDDDTKVKILINDENKRVAGYYGNKVVSGNTSTIAYITNGAYFPGDDETLPIQLEASEPTGEIKTVGALPLAVTREADLSDFNSGGSVQLFIATVGHDTWNIKSFSLTLYFNNDSHSPRRITWNGFTVSQDAGTKFLEFDKNFNPIQ